MPAVHDWVIRGFDARVREGLISRQSPFYQWLIAIVNATAPTTVAPLWTGPSSMVPDFFSSVLELDARQGVSGLKRAFGTLGLPSDSTLESHRPVLDRVPGPNPDYIEQFLRMLLGAPDTVFLCDNGDARTVAAQILLDGTPLSEGTVVATDFAGQLTHGEVSNLFLSGALYDGKTLTVSVCNQILALSGQGLQSILAKVKFVSEVEQFTAASLGSSGTFLDIGFELKVDGEPFTSHSIAKTVIKYLRACAVCSQCRRDGHDDCQVGCHVCEERIDEHGAAVSACGACADAGFQYPSRLQRQCKRCRSNGWLCERIVPLLVVADGAYASAFRDLHTWRPELDVYTLIDPPHQHRCIGKPLLNYRLEVDGMLACYSVLWALRAGADVSVRKSLTDLLDESALSGRDRHSQSLFCSVLSEPLATLCESVKSVLVTLLPDIYMPWRSAVTNATAASVGDFARVVVSHRGTIFVIADHGVLIVGRESQANVRSVFPLLSKKPPSARAARQQLVDERIPISAFQLRHSSRFVCGCIISESPCRTVLLVLEKAEADRNRSRSRWLTVHLHFRNNDAGAQIVPTSRNKKVILSWVSSVDGELDHDDLLAAVDVTVMGSVAADEEAVQLAVATDDRIHLVSLSVHSTTVVAGRSVPLKYTSAVRSADDVGHDVRRAILRAGTHTDGGHDLFYSVQNVTGLSHRDDILLISDAGLADTSMGCIRVITLPFTRARDYTIGKYPRFPRLGLYTETDPRGICVDEAGNTYVTDATGCCVVHLDTKAVFDATPRSLRAISIVERFKDVKWTRVAGSGAAKTSDGPALSADLNRPLAVCAHRLMLLVIGADCSLRTWSALYGMAKILRWGAQFAHFWGLLARDDRGDRNQSREQGLCLVISRLLGWNTTMDREWMKPGQERRGAGKPEGLKGVHAVMAYKAFQTMIENPAEMQGLRKTVKRARGGEDELAKIAPHALSTNKSLEHGFFANAAVGFTAPSLEEYISRKQEMHRRLLFQAKREHGVVVECSTRWNQRAGKRTKRRKLQRKEKRNATRWPQYQGKLPVCQPVGQGGDDEAATATMRAAQHLFPKSAKNRIRSFFRRKPTQRYPHMLGGAMEALAEDLYCVCKRVYVEGDIMVHCSGPECPCNGWVHPGCMLASGMMSKEVAQQYHESAIAVLSEDVAGEDAILSDDSIFFCAHCKSVNDLVAGQRK